MATYQDKRKQIRELVISWRANNPYGTSQELHKVLVDAGFLKATSADPPHRSEAQPPTHTITFQRANIPADVATADYIPSPRPPTRPGSKKKLVIVYRD
jgi:hypothetical protein